MRVLFISPYPPAKDGIGDYTHAMAAAIRKVGSDFRIIVPSESGPAADIIGHMSVAGGHARSQRLRLAIAGWDPDVVHVQFAVAAFGERTMALMRLVHKLRHDFGLPVVVTLHEVNRELPLLGRPGRMMHHWISRHADHVIVHTDIAHRALVERVDVPVDKITVLPYPHPPRPRSTSTPADLRARHCLGDARILLAFGFIHIDKGLDDLIEALRLIQDSDPSKLTDVRVVLAGAVRPRSGVFRAFELRDRHYLSNLLRKVKVNALERLVTWTGYVPAGEIAPWFDVADAVVLPYRRIEQSGVAGLALSLGVPVLGSTAGGLAAQLGESPWTYPPATPGQLAKTILEFLSAPSPLHVARDVSAGADLDSVALATLEIYDKALSRARNLSGLKPG